MKGLLLKNYYMALKNCRSYLILILMFTGFSVLSPNNSFSMIYPCIISGMLPVTLLAFDERDHWNEYSKTLPISKSQVVSASYLTGMIFNVFVVAFVLTINITSMVTKQVSLAGNIPQIIAQLIPISLLSPALVFPCIFAFGIEKGRIAYYFVVGGASALVTIFSISSDSVSVPNASPSPVLLVLVALAVYFLSWFLSIYLYNRRKE